MTAPLRIHPAGIRPLLPPAALLIALFASPLSAQIGEPVEERDECLCPGDLEVHLDRVETRLDRLRDSRAQLGVYLGDAVRVDGHDGVQLAAVPEGSPARRAGLAPGDIVVTLDGRPLGEGAAAELRSRMGDIEPGDTVSVGYYRDGQRAEARVVTGASSLSLRGPDGLDGMLRPLAYRFATRDGDPSRLARPAASVIFRELAPGGLELAPVNPALGRYFATDRGVLVIDVEDDSALGLQPGDVILAIDGRDVRDPAHARSILRSYRPDEEVTLSIVRDQRRSEVSGATR